MSLEKIAELKQEMAALRAKVQKDGKLWLEQAFKDFFVANPQIESIYWTQYTPYFNDGDICRFRINDFEAEPADGYDPDVAQDKTIDLERQIVDYELFTLVFGDHKSITATKDGLRVESYDDHY